MLLHLPGLLPCAGPSASLPTPSSSRGTDNLGPGTYCADPPPSDPPQCQRSELLLQLGFLDLQTHPSPLKAPGAKSICLTTLKFLSPEMRLSCHCGTRSNTYLLRLPQLVLGSAREETDGQVLELAQTPPACWYPKDAAPNQGETRPAGTALWLAVRLSLIQASRTPGHSQGLPGPK